jgi:hypothetical protein
MGDSHFPDLGTRWRWVVSFTPQLFCPLGRAPGTHWIGGWVAPEEKRKFLTLPGLELWPLGRPARSQSLYRLCYRGSPRPTDNIKINNLDQFLGYIMMPFRLRGCVAWIEIERRTWKVSKYLAGRGRSRSQCNIPEIHEQRDPWKLVTWQRSG